MSDNSQKKNNIKTSVQPLSLKKEEKITDFSNLLSEVTNLMDTADKLDKNNKLEEEKNILMEAYENLESNLPQINNEYGNNNKCQELFLLYKKILSTIALCYYRQKNYKEAIIYDLKMISYEPKNDETIIRLFNSYSKINKSQQAIFYGELFMELDEETKGKYRGMEKNIEEEKQKLIKIHQNRIKKNIMKFGGCLLIIPLSILLFYLLKK